MHAVLPFDEAGVARVYYEYYDERTKKYGGCLDGTQYKTVKVLCFPPLCSHGIEQLRRFHTGLGLRIDQC